MDNIIYLPGNISVDQVVGDFQNKMTVDSSPIQNSTNLINSGGVYNALIDTIGYVPFGITESTSTSTAFSAIIEDFENVTSLKSGLVCCIKNTKVASAANFTLNIKKSSTHEGFGAKPVYTNNAADTRATTQFAKDYKCLFIYDESLNSNSGGWYVGQLWNTNTTYSAMSVSEGTTGTATTGRTMTAKNLKSIIQTHAPQSDWDATTGGAVILNKPYVPTIVSLTQSDYDDLETKDSDTIYLITS